jgi:inner membrane transporter RhtA
MSLEPAVAGLVGFLFLGQTLELRAVIAVACVITASIGATRASADQDPLAIDG